RPECIPPAGRANSFHFKVRLPPVAVLQGPAAIVAPRAADNVNCVSKAWIAGGVDRLEVIERAQDIVMPARREGEAKENRLDNLARAMGAEQPVHQQELATATLGGSHGGDLAPAIELIISQPFESKNGRVNRRVGCAKPSPAVPAAIRHLLLEE